MLLFSSPESCPSSQSLSFCPPHSRLSGLFLQHRSEHFCALISPPPPCPQEAVLAPCPGTCGFPGPEGCPLQPHLLCLQHTDGSGPSRPSLWCTVLHVPSLRMPLNSSSLTSTPGQPRCPPLLRVLGPAHAIPLCLLLLTERPPCPHHRTTRTVSPGKLNLHPATCLRSHLS